MKVKQIGIAIIAVTLLAGQFVWAQASAAQEQTAPGAGANDTQKGPATGHRMGRRGMGGQRGFEAMAKRLNLTQDQQTRIQSLMQQQRQQAQSIRQDTSLTPGQKREKLEQLRNQTHDQVQSVLTPEQQQQWQQMRKQRGGLAALNLTPDQRSKLQPIFQSSRQQMQAVRQDSSLTPEQKRQKMQDIRNNMQSQVNSILTPEQQQQWQQMREQRGRHGRRGAPAPPPSGN